MTLCSNVADQMSCAANYFRPSARMINKSARNSPVSRYRFYNVEYNTLNCPAFVRREIRKCLAWNADSTHTRVRTPASAVLRGLYRRGRRHAWVDRTPARSKVLEGEHREDGHQGGEMQRCAVHARLVCCPCARDGDDRGREQRQRPHEPGIFDLGASEREKDG